jgi:hypothetical protein
MSTALMQRSHDFCQRLSDSEIMTILIHFHQSQYRSFQAYYT